MASVDDKVRKRSLAYDTLDDEIEVDNLKAKGTVPDWIEGSLFRNGPAKFETANQDLNHWFDGYAMLHLFTIDDGDIGYKNKFLRSQAYESANDDKMAFAEFGTDPCRDIFERFFTYFLPPQATDNANVNIGKIADDYVAMTETPMPVRFDPETLETLEVAEYEEVDGEITTAHPHYDYDREATINYITQFSFENTYKVFQIPDETGEEELLGEVDVHEPSYMHSFGMSQSYVILTEFPLVVNPLKIIVGHEPFIDAYEWKSNWGVRFTVIDKSTGEVVARTESDESFFGFHHVNAYEEEDELIVDLLTYDDADVIQEFYLDNIMSEDFSPGTAELRRCELSFGEGEVTSEILSTEPIELPRINYGSFNAREYQYVYGVGQHEKDLPDQLIKLDVNDGLEARWHEPDTFAGEPVFVEAPDPESEDDGVVLSVMLDTENRKSFLLVLDAKTFEEQARAEVPHIIPNGFHGQFYSA